MAVNKKISQLDPGTPTDGDLLPFVDVETGNTLKTTTENFIMNNVVNNIGNSNLNTFKTSCLTAVFTNVPLHGEYEYKPDFFTENSRIVLGDQDDVTENGIWITSNDEWTRATDFEVGMNVAGAILYCNFPGNGSLYICGTPGPDLIMIVGSAEYPVYFNSPLSCLFGFVGDIQSDLVNTSNLDCNNATISNTLNVLDINTLDVSIEGYLHLTNLDASSLLYLDEDFIVHSLSTETYPSLEEIAYVKGVTSNIQNQIDAISGGTWVPYETPTPDPDDTTTSFDIQYAPLSGTQSVYKNGVFLDDEDYSISGSTITFVFAPKVTDKIRVHYAH